MGTDVKEITARVKEESSFVSDIVREVSRVIVGQEYMIKRLILALLSNGHVLLEGVPGLAKTLTVTTLSNVINTSFQRIQFTPDLLPADLVGTLIYNPKTGDFTTKKGPLFSNIILADEINRAPAKVQSALLEAMQERQVTIGEETYSMSEPFLVLATQNPIEQEGTYPLPEAQVDRFMLKLKITYPDRKEELSIQERMAGTAPVLDVSRVISPEDITQVRSVVDQIYIDPQVREYIVDLVLATRDPGACSIKDIESYIEYGASPRATIYLTLAAKAHAFMEGRGYVTPQDVKDVGMDVLRHRVILTYEAEADEVTPEKIVQRIFDEIEVP